MKETILTTKLRIKTPLPGLRVHQNLRKGYPVFYKAGRNFRTSFLFSLLFTYFMI